MTASTRPVPFESETEDTAEYQTGSRGEIIAILKSIVTRRMLVTLYYNDSREYLVTNLLHVNPDFEELIFDGAPQPAANSRVLASQRMFFVTFVDDIKVQFSAEHAETTSFEGRPALRIRLPGSIMRLQRRNYYRVQAPRAGPLLCEIEIAPGKAAKFVVGDLSVGGIGVLAGPAIPGLQPGMVYENCRIELPDHGDFTTALKVRHAEGPVPNGRNLLRFQYGCEFHHLSGPVVSLIQRYINQIERNRRALV